MGGVQNHERRGKTNRRTVALDFQREGFGLLWDLLGMGYRPGKKKDPGELVDSKDYFLQAQEQCTPAKGKSHSCGRRSA